MFLPICIIGLIGKWMFKHCLSYSFWTVSGNSWVIYVVKINKHLRTPTNLIVGNMAVADMLSTIIYPCFIVVYDYFQNYQLGVVGCKGEGPLECESI